MKLTPAILTDSFATFQQQYESVKFSPLIDAVQMDVIDGNFAENITLTPLDVTVAEFEPLKLDLHLMVEEPMDYVYECSALKEYLPIRRVYGQIERMSHQQDFLHEVRMNGWEAGLALDLFTPLEAIDEDLWVELKYILLMNVEAGAQEQQFNPHVFEKIDELRKHFPNPERMNIMIDGGVKSHLMDEILTHGVDEVAVGSELWQSEDPLLEIEKFYTATGKKKGKK